MAQSTFVVVRVCGKRGRVRKSCTVRGRGGRMERVILDARGVTELSAAPGKMSADCQTGLDRRSFWGAGTQSGI